MTASPERSHENHFCPVFCSYESVSPQFLAGSPPVAVLSRCALASLPGRLRRQSSSDQVLPAQLSDESAVAPDAINTALMVRTFEASHLYLDDQIVYGFDSPEMGTV